MSGIKITKELEAALIKLRDAEVELEATPMPEAPHKGAQRILLGAMPAAQRPPPRVDGHTARQRDETGGRVMTRDERDFKKLQRAWVAASPAARLRVVDDCIVPHVGAQVVRGEIAADQACAIVEGFRANAVRPQSLAYA